MVDLNRIAADAYPEEVFSESDESINAIVG
jgi:hypothetical protein